MNRAGVYVRSSAALVPERVVSNDEIGRLLAARSAHVSERERSEYLRRVPRIEGKTGIRERRFFSDTEDASSIGLSVAEAVVGTQGWHELDAVLVSSSSTQGFPGLSQAVVAKLRERHHELGHPFVLDVGSNACTSFIYALGVGSALIATGGYRSVLCLSIEFSSRCISFDIRDFNTSVLFGDAAGGFLLSAQGGFARLGPVRLGSLAKPETLGLIEGSGQFLPEKGGSRAVHHWKMAGPEVAKWAVELLADELRTSRDAGGDFDWVVPHQANLGMILAPGAERAGVDPRKLLTTLEFAGNTSTASLPLTFDHHFRAGRFEPGHRVLLVSFGSSFSVGSAMMEIGGAGPKLPVHVTSRSRSPFQAATTPVRVAREGVGVLAVAATSVHEAEALAVEEIGRWRPGEVRLREEVLGQQNGEQVQRLALVGASADEVMARLGGSGPCFRARVSHSPRVAFLFTGQGSLRPGTTAELYAAEPTFRRWFDRCAEIASFHFDRPLPNLLYGVSAGDAALQQTRLGQPLVFAVDYALARMWMAWGVEPCAVVGHSLGEYVAACIAGVFTLEDALWLVVQRARLMQGVSTSGAMAAVIGGRDEVLPLVAQIEGLEIAAYNAPRALTVSGDESAIRQLLARLPDVGATGLALPVSHAFHSRHLDPILPEFERYVRAVERKPPSLLLVSNVTGRSVAGDVSRSGYWVEQMRRPVQFESALRWLSEREQIGAYLEVGPDRVLGSFVRQCVPGVANVSTLVHSQPEVNTALAAAASLWVQGVSIDWSGPRLLCGGESGGDVQTARPERAILDELQAGALTVSQAMELMLEARRGAVRTAATGRV